MTVQEVREGARKRGKEKEKEGRRERKEKARNSNQTFLLNTTKVSNMPSKVVGVFKVFPVYGAQKRPDPLWNTLNLPPHGFCPS